MDDIYGEDGILQTKPYPEDATIKVNKNVANNWLTMINAAERTHPEDLAIEDYQLRDEINKGLFEGIKMKEDLK